MPHNPKYHGRRSIRLAGYDYTQAGAYFVTICTQDRRPLLAHISATGHALTPIGQVVARSWLALPRHFPHVTLDGWVLMPDHLHGIVVLRASTAELPTSLPADRPTGTHPGSLNALVQNFKSVSTRKANQHGQTSRATLWQRNYYEHIIRDAADLQRIRRYIENNPARWRSR